MGPQSLRALELFERVDEARGHNPGCVEGLSLLLTEQWHSPTLQTFMHALNRVSHE